MNFMLPQISNYGATGKTYYSLYEEESPCVVVGSSRASHHYIATAIQDSLCIDTYNLGVDGQFFSYACCVINNILDRYTPNIIIWECDPDALYNGSADPLEALYPYYGKNKHVTDVINDEEDIETRMSLHSNFLKYNSSAIKIILRYLTVSNFRDDDNKGYIPLLPKEHEVPLEYLEKDCEIHEISEYKVEKLKDILSRSKELGVQVIMVNSPMYRIDYNRGKAYNVMEQITGLYGMNFIDNSNVADVVKHPEFFNDNKHLNSLGAEYYTEIFIDQMHDLL